MFFGIGRERDEVDQDSVYKWNCCSNSKPRPHCVSASKRITPHHLIRLLNFITASTRFGLELQSVQFPPGYHQISSFHWLDVEQTSSWRIRYPFTPNFPQRLTNPIDLSQCKLYLRRWRILNVSLLRDNNDKRSFNTVWAWAFKASSFLQVCTKSSSFIGWTSSRH